MKDQLKARLLGIAISVAAFAFFFAPTWGTRW